jgi:DNA-binding response OmpR family regulator
MAKKILVIDDEPKIVEICRDYLKAAGFEVASAEDGPRGLAAARHEQPDLIVLDLMLPGMDEVDKLVGLELGADDYITKPFSPRELVARVRTVLRRTSGDHSMDVLRVGELTLDRGRYILVLSGREEALTPTEFEILYTLASQPGRIFTRSQLLNAVHGVAFESYERAIDSHIRNLRRKLEVSEEEPRYIITVYGVGYKFVE